MTEFYAGRHAAARSTPKSHRVGFSALAVAALGVGTSALTTTGASAAPATPATPAVPTTPSVPTTPAVPSTPSFSGYVSWGDSGSVVRDIQREVGVSVDGVFGPRTHAAVKDYQRGHGLTVDGIVGPATGSEMGLGGSSSGGSSSGSTSSSDFSGLISFGDRGGDVREVQRIVGVSADGVFGSNTYSAVKSWQRSHGLTADGVVGPVTGSAMGLDGSSGGSNAGSSAGSSDSSSGSSSSSSSVLGTAAGLVGTHYAWGGTSPSTGFDCSGFTQYVFAQNGISIPRMTGAQQAAATPVSNPQPGDLVFFGSPAYHVGIYAGNGMMYDAGNSRVDTTKRAIWTSNVTYGRF